MEVNICKLYIYEKGLVSRILKKKKTKKNLQKTVWIENEQTWKGYTDGK